MTPALFFLKMVTLDLPKTRATRWHGNPKPTVVVRVRRVRWERILCVNIFPGIMARLSKEQRIFVLTSYFETKSFKTAKQKFLQHFPNVPIPVNSTIMRSIDKFKDTGNMSDEQWLFALVRVLVSIVVIFNTCYNIFYVSGPIST